LYEAWHERCGIRGKVQRPTFLIFYDGEDERAKTRNCGLGARRSPGICLRKTVICNMSWRKGATSWKEEGSGRRSCRNVFVSLILIRVADPLKSAKLFKDRHVGFEVILAVTIRIMLVSDMTPFSLIKFICFYPPETSVPLNSTVGQSARLQKTVAFLLFGCGS